MKKDKYDFSDLLQKESCDYLTEEDFYPLQVMMEDHLGNYNKVVWFIESMLK